MIYNTDCQTFLTTCKHYDLMFLDPPDNLGIDYSDYIDNRPDYYDWLMNIINISLVKCNYLWLSIHSKHDFNIKKRLHLPPQWSIRTIIWRYTFGQYREKDHTYGYRPLIRLSKGPIDTSTIRVQSQRHLDGDKRAAGTTKVADDVWEFPRIVKGNPEYCTWHPCQHPIGICCRMLKSGIVKNAVELFGGTGPLLKAGKQLGIPVDYVDLSINYCNHMRA